MRMRSEAMRIRDLEETDLRMVRLWQIDARKTRMKAEWPKARYRSMRLDLEMVKSEIYSEQGRLDDEGEIDVLQVNWMIPQVDSTEGRVSGSGGSRLTHLLRPGGVNLPNLMCRQPSQCFDVNRLQQQCSHLLTACECLNWIAALFGVSGEVSLPPSFLTWFLISYAVMEEHQNSTAVGRFVLQLLHLCYSCFVVLITLDLWSVLVYLNSL